MKQLRERYVQLHGLVTGGSAQAGGSGHPKIAATPVAFLCSAERFES